MKRNILVLGVLIPLVFMFLGWIDYKDTLILFAFIFLSKKIMDSEKLKKEKMIYKKWIILGAFLYGLILILVLIMNVLLKSDFILKPIIQSIKYFLMLVGILVIWENIRKNRI